MSEQATLDISDAVIQNAYRILNAVGENAKSGEKEQLFDDADYVDLVIQYDMDGDKKSTPRVVELKHSLFNAEIGDSAILLTTNNDTKTKEYLEEHPVSGLTKVTSMDKIRTTIATPKQKRDLLRAYKRILCDKAILPMMSSILGNKMFKWNRQPYAITLTKENAIVKNVEKALSSTCFFVNCSPNMSVKVGYDSFTEEQIVDNVRVVLDEVFKHINTKNILTLGLTVIDC